MNDVRRGRGWARATVLAFAAVSTPSDAAPAAPLPNGVSVLPSPRGHVGAWLTAGPFRLPAAPGTSQELLDFVPSGVDEARLTPNARSNARLGELPWQLAVSEGAGLDLKSHFALGPKDKDIVAYAGLILEVKTRGRYYLLLSVDDGVRVFVDGKATFTRDEPRPARDDDDVVPLDLGSGAHTIVLKLHQRDGAFGFRARLLDATWRPAGRVILPGTRPDDADRMVKRMSFVSIDRGLTEDGYEPRVTITFPDGVPAEPSIKVSARVVDKEGDVLTTTTTPLLVPTRGDTAGELEVALPPLEGTVLGRVEDRALTVAVDVGARQVRAPFWPRKATRLSARRALHALASVPAARPPWLKPGSFEGIEAQRRRLVHLVSRGDADLDVQTKEARELDAAAARIEAQQDPYEGKIGALRRAYRSPVDGELQPYALYVPKGHRTGAERRSWPLIVVLHGLNGKPTAMLRWFFGGDDPKRDQAWEDRRAEDLLPLDAFVLSPNGHGNAMYRQLGQDDVMRAVDEVMALYPIDPARVTVTGPSMGGIGAASVALRFPDRFAAAAPLCGYHSVFVRRDVQGKRLRPWEKFLAEERSNVAWAANGRDLPLFVVHGTQDTPVENSGALIDRYEALKFPIVHEHPALGHNVWQPTYEDLKGARWLLRHSRNLHPRTIDFRTARLREGKHAWASIEELTAPDAWGELEAKVRSRSQIDVKTRGVAQLRFERDEKLVDPALPLEVAVDGQKLLFAPSVAAVFHRDGATWKPGPRPASSQNGAVSLRKRAGLSGPLRDVFHEPLTFVYGTSDPAEARANEEVARVLARIRFGVEVRYPVVSDRDFLAREAIASDRALFLIGAAHSNAVVRAIERELPIKVGKDHVMVGTQKITGGRELGAAFVFPNPARRDRSMAIVAGTNALGTLRALSLPDLVPDFVVYDERVRPARGQMILGAGTVLAAGFFRTDWTLPSSVADPFSGAAPPRLQPTRDTEPDLE